jgi:hypothetical protein
VSTGSHYFAQLEQINIQVQLACCILRRLRALGTCASKAQRTPLELMCIYALPAEQETFIGLSRRSFCKKKTLQIFKALFLFARYYEILYD